MQCSEGLEVTHRPKGSVLGPYNIIILRPQ